MQVLGDTAIDVSRATSSMAETDEAVLKSLGKLTSVVGAFPTKRLRPARLPALKNTPHNKPYFKRS